MRPKAARMNDALRDAFVVKVKNFLPKMEIFQCGRPPGTDLQGVLIVSNRDSLLRGKRCYVVGSGLMSFAAAAKFCCLIIEPNGLANILRRFLGHVIPRRCEGRRGLDAARCP